MFFFNRLCCAVNMDYEIIQGVRENSKLLHVISEDKLYVLKVTRNGAKEFICYQNILCGKEKEGINENKCTARVKLFPNGTLRKMGTKHTCNTNHDMIRRDMNKRTNMKKKCQALKKNHPEDSHKISTRFIYQREISE